MAAAAGAAAATTQQAAPAGSVSTAQRLLLRAHADKQVGLARQVVVRAEQTRRLPHLADLLVERSWRAALAGERGKPYWAGLEAFVRAEWGGSQMTFPPKHAIFRCGLFRLLPAACCCGCCCVVWLLPCCTCFGRVQAPQRWSLPLPSTRRRRRRLCSRRHLHPPLNATAARSIRARWTACGW